MYSGKICSKLTEQLNGNELVMYVTNCYKYTNTKITEVFKVGPEWFVMNEWMNDRFIKNDEIDLLEYPITTFLSYYDQL